MFNTASYTHSVGLGKHLQQGVPSTWDTVLEERVSVRGDCPGGFCPGGLSGVNVRTPERGEVSAALEDEVPNIKGWKKRQDRAKFHDGFSPGPVVFPALLFGPSSRIFWSCIFSASLVPQPAEERQAGARDRSHRGAEGHCGRLRTLLISNFRALRR